MSDKVDVATLLEVINADWNEAEEQARLQTDIEPMAPLVVALRYRYMIQLIHKAIARDKSRTRTGEQK